jgi:hypothetical protein
MSSDSNLQPAAGAKRGAASLVVVLTLVFLVTGGLRLLLASNSGASSAEMTLESSRALRAWRTSGSLAKAVADAQDGQAPASVDEPLLQPVTPADTFDPAEASRWFEWTVYSEERRRCDLLLQYVAAAHRSQAHANRIRDEHESRIEAVAQQFPAIRQGVRAWQIAFSRSIASLESDLSDYQITITTTQTSGRRQLGSYDSTVTGLQHWAAELKAMRGHMDRAATVRLPYERMIAVQRAVQKYNHVLGELRAMPQRR